MILQVQFEDLEPTKIDSMTERGLVPQWGADAAKLYPDLWPTAQAAQKAYRRAGLDVERIHARCRTSPPDGGTQARCRTCPYKDIFIRTCTAPHFLLRFHPNGRGQKARVASSWRRRWGRWHRSKCSRASPTRTSREPLAHASRPRASRCGSPVATGRPTQRC